MKKIRCKHIKLIFAFAFVVLSFVSCKNEEQENAKVAVDDYTKYVDSISKMAASEALTNWESIQIDLEKAKARAEVSLENVSNKKALRSSIDKGSFRYGKYKNSILAEKYKREAKKKQIQKALFGKTIPKDMKFEWVNKDNILKVYQNFVATVKKNKDTYTIEDWDEVKLLYEALDARKNIVEENGLSSSDYNKISLLKLKFGPMYRLNRLGAKSDEDLNSKK
ncbi:MAG: hypothetical protein V4666_08725 [Bacteroidota bacterium]